MAYRELIRTRGIELLPGVRRWLEKLKDEGWLQAVASSAPRLNIEAIIAETAAATITERGATRLDDQTAEASMELRKKEGYF